MKTYDIWIEGYRATCEHGRALYMGSAKGETFQEACETFFATHHNKDVYNPRTNSYWACKLFDNEADARKRFG